ncbi:YicC family protein [Clostridium botulinum C]|uniref:YicC family protein n=2 Tax=Clostridium botulinum TaxID=1491 RepID=A0A9Q4XXE5_CLOBO|nr:YicC/YloC family endoribonuclease [Clostridium botulinum]MCD3194407.1 YicC family protein [Clostridium botulinum C]MCD3199561.1 YicC family protein [Clostridium botulinum C]MCD3205036.1 YicC family protein [Clostridium botulinum C]MCD3207854.1 YicC family protein [Clostridium botulinum C]MCD3225319.1 YicC family protein [Clostridium botulinum C]
MLRSMTGFGRGMTKEGSNRSFTIEIKSVNHRYFDLNLKMPRNLLSLENKIREVIKQKINRGKVDVFITQNVYGNDDIEVKFNEQLADSYFKCLEKIKDRYDTNNDISVSLIAKFPEVISVEKKEEDSQEIWDYIEQPLNDAVESLVNMREKEGKKLKEDVINKCNIIQESLKEVEKRAPLVVKDYKNRLNNRIIELLDNSDIDESRISMEVAVFADKAAIDEEVVRLNSHIVQLKDTLEKNEPVGRKLDFIVQEMNRETNTISSKANDLQIVNLTINMKNYIEKIREQIQNIE